MRTFEETKELVIKWGEERDLYKESDPLGQVQKLQEEFLELYGEIFILNEFPGDEDIEEIADGIGDMMVVLIHIAKMCKLDIVACLNSAYEEIKDRKGRMIKGKFVKDIDLTNHPWNENRPKPY